MLGYKYYGIGTYIGTSTMLGYLIDVISDALQNNLTW